MRSVMRSVMKKLVALSLALALLGFAATACSPRMAEHMLGAAIVTAALVGTAHAVAVHDAHYHHYNCGCPREWHGGRWVYYYHGGWEYYDPYAGVWFRYR